MSQAIYIGEHIAPPVMPDEQLEFWANYFIDNNLAARGILFETFLCAPHEIAEAVIFGRPESGGFYPLLPRQALAAESIAKQYACECWSVDGAHFLCAACAGKYAAYDYLQERAP